MNFLRAKWTRFKAYRLAHFTVFFVVEQLILLSIMTIMLFVTKVSKISTSIDNSEVLNTIGYTFEYLDVTRFVWLIPLGTSVICFFYSLVVILIKDVFKKPIIARKVSKPFLAFTIAAFFAGAIILTMFQTQRFKGEGIYLQYDHRLALCVTIIAQTLVVVDAFNWRQEFGLEKSYGSNDPVL